MSGNRRIYCEKCKKLRTVSQYKSLMIQGYEEAVCAQCRQQYPSNPKGKMLYTINETQEMRKCLGNCGRSFLTVKNKRFCHKCKNKQEHYDEYSIVV